MTANAKSKTYGAANPALDAVVTRQRPAATRSTTAWRPRPRRPSGVGSYPITVTLGANPNYDVTSTDATLTVTQGASRR